MREDQRLKFKRKHYSLEWKNTKPWQHRSEKRIEQKDCWVKFNEMKILCSFCVIFNKNYTTYIMGYLSTNSYRVLKHTQHRKNHASDWVKITVSFLSNLMLFHANSSILRKTAHTNYTSYITSNKMKKITELNTKLVLPSAFINVDI